MCRRCRWPTGLRQTAWGLSRSASSRYDRRRRPLYRGEALVFQNLFWTNRFLTCTLLAGTPHMVHRSGMVSHTFTFRWLGLTRPQQGFTSVRRIGLSLACSSGESEPLDIAAPASYPAVTSDALRVGNRLEHWPEAVLPAHALDATSCRTSKNPHHGTNTIPIIIFTNNST